MVLCWLFYAFNIHNFNEQLKSNAKLFVKTQSAVTIRLNVGTDPNLLRDTIA
jgi:hypothetical protein